MKRVLKSVICFVLCLGIFVSGLVLSTKEVYADSADRIRTFIKLAADSKNSEDGSLLDGLTEDQLRFLGVYLSNFYIPFGSEIGTSEDSEVTKSTKQDMIKSLQTKFAFSDDLAASLVEIVLSYTRSAKDLSVYMKEGDDYISLNEFIACNYYNFYRIMIGRADDVFFPYLSYFSDKMKKREKIDDKYNPIVELYNKKYDKLYFGYEEDGKVVPVCDASIFNIGYKGQPSGGRADVVVGDNIKYIGLGYEEGFLGAVDYTASQIAFMKCLESVDIKNGYGLNMFDFNKADDIDYDSFAIDENFSDEEIYEMSNFGSSMKVDCFGDIILWGGNHKYVAIPGCMNPYSWVQVKANGEDKEDSAGSAYNSINAISMSRALSNSKGEGKNALMFAYNEDYGTFKADFSILNGMLEDGVHASSDFWGGNSFDDKYAVAHYRVMQGDSKFNIGDFKGFWVDTAKATPFKKCVDRFFKNHQDDLTGTFAKGYMIKNTTVSVEIVIPRSYYRGEGVDSYGVADYFYTKLLSNVVFIDSLGVYQDKEYNAFNVANFFNDKGEVGGDYKDFKVVNSNTGSLYSDIKSGNISLPESASEKTLSSIYVTYCFACLYDEDTKKDTIGRLGYRFNFEGMPSMELNPLDFGSLLDEIGSNAELQSITDWVYYILHPTEGFQYVTLWIKNKVNHLLLGWHNDMLGTNGVGVNVGTTKYRSTMGYVTMPDLSEIQWTNSLINFYNNCVPFLIVLLIVVMVFAFVTKSIGFQQAVIGVLLFAVFSLLPVNMINATVQESNRITQNIYGDKFTYWALVQQETYSSAIDKAAMTGVVDLSSSEVSNSGTAVDNSSSSSSSNTSSSSSVSNEEGYANYLRTLYSANEAVYSNQGADSILLKWQAPKKMASLVLTEKDANLTSGLGSMRKMLSGMLNSSYSGETFLTDEEEYNYLYRSYTDISNFSRYIYKGLKDKYVNYSGVFGGGSVGGKTIQASSMTGFDRYSDINKNFVTNSAYKNYVNDGYLSTKLTSGNVDNTTMGDTFYMTVPLTSGIINDLLNDVKKNPVSEYSTSDDKLRINQDIFNFGLPQFSSKKFTDRFSIKTFAATAGLESSDTRYKELEKYMKNGSSAYTANDYAGLAAFGLYSENPYYYFSWKLYSDGMNYEDANATGEFKNIILRDKGGYFYNIKGNGELKDFMNMKGLFSIVIPYMKQCNDIVREWDDTFGVTIYEGVPTEEGHWDEVKDDPVLAQKYWHNLNVARLYCIYCPWVDVMYDCSYAQPETITVLGERVTIDDPLDPYSYPSNRPMIFSESEMKDYGLSEADLTKVEQLILKCNRGYLDRLYELLNYYNFSDVSLNSAAAINCAFVFNGTFSESGMFTNNHIIYPQSFDISNFSYDAFLRLALSNATGEDLLDDTSLENTYAGTTTGDFYERLVNRSSVVTVLVMLILDVVSVYVIPAVRIFFLIALFVAVIMLIVVAALKIEENMKFVRRILSRFFIPLILFFLTTIGFAYILSFFMGVGSNAVTQSDDFSISLGDPVMTMLIMLLLNVILIILYWKIIRGVLKDLKQSSLKIASYGRGLGSAVAGFVGGLATASVHEARNVVNSGKADVKRIAGDIKSRSGRKAGKGTDDRVDNLNNNAPVQEGTGIESSRANERGASRASDTAEDDRSVRNPSASRDLDRDRSSLHESDIHGDDRKMLETYDINSKAMNGNIVDAKGVNSRDRKSNNTSSEPKEAKGKD